MKYESTFRTKDGRSGTLRSARPDEAKEMLGLYLQTHEETDMLACYPDECTFTVEGEREFLALQEKNDRAVELFAVLDSRYVGSAGIHPLGEKEKMRRRAGFGISVIRDCWGLGVGRALTDACIECAKKAGFSQLELEVVEANTAAVALYKSAGFVEYGRNPRGFHSRYTGWQPLLLMRLELD